MRFDCGKRSKAEREKLRVRCLRWWHPWFAWKPVRIGPHDCRWLEWVERRKNPKRNKWLKHIKLWMTVHDEPEWEYRA